MPVRKNTHQQHMESLVMFGEDGLKEINYKLENFIRGFDDVAEPLNVTTKIDGAPAVICWSRMKGYPDNSICLKSFVNGAQNAMSTPEEVDTKYGDRPAMSSMLKYCLQIAKSIPAGQAWQGDCLFTSETKKEKDINGEKCIVFQPNKVVYSFSESNPNFDKIANADFGICFHTIYSAGKDGMNQSFRIDPSVLNVPENIYVMSPAVSMPKVGFNTKDAMGELKELKELEKKLIGNPAYNELCNNQAFMSFWSMFENHITADKAATHINVNTFYDELVDFIAEKQNKAYDTKMSKLKTDAGKEKATNAYNSEVEEMKNILSSHKDVLKDIVNVFNKVVDIKMMIFKHLKSAKQDYDTYLYKANGEYEPTSGEGWSMSDMDGNIVKIVDRSEFAHANRSKDYLSGFEHESLEEDKDKKLSLTTQAIRKILGQEGKPRSGSMQLLNRNGLAYGTTSYIKDGVTLHYGYKDKSVIRGFVHGNAVKNKSEIMKRIEDVGYEVNDDGGFGFSVRLQKSLEEDGSKIQDRAAYNKVYNILQDYAQENRLKKKKVKDYNNVYNYIKKLFREGYISKSMANKLMKLTQSYESIDEDYELGTEENKAVSHECYIIARELDESFSSWGEVDD